MPPANREKLEKAISLIDAANTQVWLGTHIGIYTCFSLQPLNYHVREILGAQFMLFEADVIVLHWVICKKEFNGRQRDRTMCLRSASTCRIGVLILLTVPNCQLSNLLP